MTPPDPRPAGPPLSKARRAGSLLFLSGQMPRNAAGDIVTGDIEVQTRQVLDNLQAALAANSAGFAQVVKVTAWLTDARHFDGFNRVYREYFLEPYPARSTVVSQLVAPGADVEVEVTALLD
jgi:2-iminobutanoate/2-iminopropanoate deaminase